MTDDQINEILDKGLIEAQKSPCVRRKYYSQVYFQEFLIAVGRNDRFAPCCNGVCARNRFRPPHGQRVELGAEIHSEQMAVIQAGPHDDDTEWKFFLSGVESESGAELLGYNVRPCHSCALSIKYAGFKYVIHRDAFRNIEWASIDQIIEDREEEWQPAL